MMVNRSQTDEMADPDRNGRLPAIVLLKIMGPILLSAMLSGAVVWGVTSSRLNYMEKELDKRATAELVIYNNQIMLEQHKLILTGIADEGSRLRSLERSVAVNTERLDRLERRR